MVTSVTEFWYIWFVFYDHMRYRLYSFLITIAYHMQPHFVDELTSLFKKIQKWSRLNLEICCSVKLKYLWKSRQVYNFKMFDIS